MTNTNDVIVVGGGIYGVTAALALRARGFEVSLVDPGPLPHPLAASTDINKAVRMTYGADEDYMALGEEAIAGWKVWNETFNDTLYHEVGMVWLSQVPLRAGSFVFESFELLNKRGHGPQRLSQDDIRERFPAFNAEKYTDGFFNSNEGYAESGRAVATLLQQAERDGVSLLAGQDVVDVLIEGERAVGVKTKSGEIFNADAIILAAGAWTPYLYPPMLHFFRTTGQPIYHLKPSDPSLFEPPNFVTFGADIAETGWYGFPLHPRENVVKVGYHSLAHEVHPIDDERIVTDDQIADLRQFLSESIPSLAEAEIVYQRCCLYCNMRDEDFLISRVPDVEGLTIATGGSGHGFKFGPVLGGLIADAVEGKENPYSAKFGWRL